jgi:hypothetical protein
MLLACHFARNLGYHRAGMRNRKPRLPEEFWKTATSNCLDISVLEWCKLFADPRDPHHWQNIVSDPASFEELLYKKLRLSADRFEAYRIATRKYRDKFLAHLDSHLIMEIPTLDIALSAACVYYSHVYASSQSTTARTFPKSLFEYYSDSRMEAARVIRAYVAEA